MDHTVFLDHFLFESQSPDVLGYNCETHLLDILVILGLMFVIWLDWMNS